MVAVVRNSLSQGEKASLGARSEAAPVRIHSSGSWRSELEIRCTGIRLAMGPRVLLENADLTILSRRRYGMVGRNGVGKSSLFAIIDDNPRLEAA